MPDDEDLAEPGGKGTDGLILNRHGPGQQAGGQLGGVKQSHQLSKYLIHSNTLHQCAVFELRATLT